MTLGSQIADVFTQVNELHSVLKRELGANHPATLSINTAGRCFLAAAIEVPDTKNVEAARADRVIEAAGRAMCSAEGT